MSSASAVRYARALFDVALKESDPSRIEQELSFHRPRSSRDTLNCGTHSKARVFRLSPKKSVVQALISRGQFTPPVGKLLLMLAERDRLTLLEPVLEAFRARLREQQRVLEAEVTTAIPLDPSSRRPAAAARRRHSASGDPHGQGGSLAHRRRGRPHRHHGV
jgi:F0F1-type ATP synthase delta subunit